VLHINRPSRILKHFPWQDTPVCHRLCVSIANHEPLLWTDHEQASAASTDHPVSERLRQSWESKRISETCLVAKHRKKTFLGGYRLFKSPRLVHHADHDTARVSRNAAVPMEGSVARVQVRCLSLRHFLCLPIHNSGAVLNPPPSLRFIPSLD